MKPGLLSALRRFMRDSSGLDMIKYALIAGFVAVATVASLPRMPHNFEDIYNNVQSVVVGADDAGQTPSAAQPTQ